MMRKAILSVLLLLGCIVGWAQDEAAVQDWNEATRSYAAHQYRNAAEHYEAIVKKHEASDVVYYNLGNAYYKNGERGKAVLNYKRALKLNASNKQARDNISFIHSKTPGAPVVLKDIFFMRWYHAVLYKIPANTWAIAALIGFLLVLFVIYRMITGKIRFGYRWLSLSTVVWLLIISFAFTGYRQGKVNTEGVVLSSQAFLYESGDMTKPRMSVPEGTVLNLIGQPKEGKVLVRLANGTEGWIDQADVEIV
ncbi:tetratricopeptide repeat protein [Edaphocola aurantiacus]|uniref:tetratricopeptide repeat protein n=1 Tax=Edaphocola aurantiacus TaxID=2601682 RepID=UPI001C9457F3|nr:tetratricopeptide repeat protein [Edaphocola aurantiacus]